MRFTIVNNVRSTLCKIVSLISVRYALVIGDGISIVNFFMFLFISRNPFVSLSQLVFGISHAKFCIRVFALAVMDVLW